MTKLHLPPGFTSICWMVVVKPFGPHQCFKCAGFVQASKTSARGGSKTRVVTISRSAVSLSLPVTLILLFLHVLEVKVQTVEPLFPDHAVVLDPVRDLLERLRREPAGTPLRLAAAGDEARALQHLEVLGDGRLAHVERPGQLSDVGLARREACQDRPPGGIGEGGKGSAQRVRSHDVSVHLVM